MLLPLIFRQIFAGKAKRNGAKPLVGFQLRYIYLIDKSCKITVPILPFSKIQEMGAGMYKGKKITREGVLNKSSLASSQEMAVTPTSSLKSLRKNASHSKSDNPSLQSNKAEIQSGVAVG